jgi:hypothetical protein
MMNNNYLLIEMNRYEVGGSTVNVVSEEFLKTFLKLQKKMGFSEAPIAKLKHEVKGWDSEEVTYLWVPTTKEVDKAGEKFMKEFMNDMEEDGII